MSEKRLPLLPAAAGLLANPRFDAGLAQRCLTSRVLAGRRGRLDLLLDATTTGATARHLGTVTLVLAAGWHGRALPLCWRTWRADAPGQDWAGAIRAMLVEVDALLPPGVVPVLMADRGLSGAPLAALARDLGWHLLVRVVRTTRLRRPDGTVSPIGDLAPEPGTAMCVAGGRAYAPRTKPAGKGVGGLGGSLRRRPTPSNHALPRQLDGRQERIGVVAAAVPPAVDVDSWRVENPGLETSPEVVLDTVRIAVPGHDAAGIVVACDPELGRILGEAVRIECALVGDEMIVDLPERSPLGGGLGQFRRCLGVGVAIPAREVPVDHPEPVADAMLQCPERAERVLGIGAFVIAVDHDGRRRIVRSTHMVIWSDRLLEIVVTAPVEPAPKSVAGGLIESIAGDVPVEGDAITLVELA